LTTTIPTAFGTAAAVTLLAIRALGNGFRPAAGVISIVSAVVSAITLSGDLSLTVSVALAGATAVGMFAVVASGYRGHAWRRLVLALASCAVVATGPRLRLTGLDAVDALVTVLWLVAAVFAVARLNRATHAAPALVAVVAVTIVALASFSGSTGVAVLAASLAATTMVFLAIGRRRGCVVLDEAGALCLGTLLGVSVLQADPTLGPMARPVVPLLVLAVPLANLAVVASWRLRQERRSEARADLVDGLVGRGLSPGAAVSLLVVAQSALGCLAVLVGRQAVPVRWAFAVLGHLTFATLSVRYRPGYGFRVRRRLVWAGGVVAVAAGLSIPAIFAMLAARSPALAGADRARLAISAANAADPLRADAALSEAATLFADADARLRRPLTSLGLIVPGLSANLRAARTLTNQSRALATDGRLLLEAGSRDLSVEGGGVSVEKLREVASHLDRSATQLRSSLRRIRSVDQPFLLPPVQRAIAEFEDRVQQMLPSADRASVAARTAAPILGADGGRRYFLAVQNNAELRGTGGFMGSFGELVAENGRLRLARLGRVDDLKTPGASPGQITLPISGEVSRRYGRYGLDWKHVNMSPDFPTVAGIIADLYPKSGGVPVDGVVAIDAEGLAALLELVGPVAIPSWPETISATNVVRVVAHDSAALDSGDRPRLLAELTDAIFQRFAAGNFGDVSSVLRVLGEAVSGRHVSVYLSRPAEQRVVMDLGLAGAVPAVRGDSLMVVNNNAAGNKADYYLKRRMRYQVSLEPGGDRAQVRSVLEASFSNSAPASGLPSGIIGPNDSRFEAGENVSLVSVHTPQALLPTTTPSDRPGGMTSDRELGRLAHTTFVRLGSGMTETLTLRLAGEVALLPGGWYRLELVRQPVLQSDDVDVEIEVAPGWRIVGTVGVEPRSAQSAGVRRQVEQDLVVAVRLERTGPGRFLDRLRYPRTGHWTHDAGLQRAGVR